MPRKIKRAKRSGLSGLFKNPARKHRKVKRSKARKVVRHRRRHVVRKYNPARKVRRRRVVRRRVARKAPVRRYRRRRTVRKHNPSRKYTRKVRRTRKSRKHVARKHYRRHNPAKRGLKRHYRKHNVGRKYRRRNAGKKLFNFKGGIVGKLRAMLMPALGLGIGLVGSRLIVGKLQQLKAGWNPNLVGIGSSLALAGLSIWAMPKLKFLPAQLKTYIPLGIGVDALMRVVGAFMPGTAIGQFMTGTLPLQLSGMGQYDVYEAGLLGQGAPGAYVQEDSDAMSGAVGSYVLEPHGTAGLGTDVYAAPAGVGAYVQDGANFNYQSSDDDEENEWLDDAALEAPEAQIEGLGAVQQQVEGQGGKLVYTTQAGQQKLTANGFHVQPIKVSAVKPGATIAAVKKIGPAALRQVMGGHPTLKRSVMALPPKGNGNGVYGGYVATHSTGSPFATVPQPTGGKLPHVAGGIFEPTYSID